MLAMVLAAGSAARRLVHAGAAVLVLVVCATRVVLGVHWASDVLGGMLLSATLLTVASALGPRGPTPSSSPRSARHGHPTGNGRAVR